MAEGVSETLREHALFDLDQTVVPWDTQLVFRSYVLRAEPWRRVFCLVFPLFLPFAPILGAGGLKRVFHCYLFGMRRARLEKFARDFVADWLEKLVYPEVLEEVRRHQTAGRVAVLSSASPELWVREIGRELGFDLIEGTRLEWGERVDFFPELLGENHKGREKVKRLAARGIRKGHTGYSDSRADVPLLELCEEKVLVNPLPMIRQEGEVRGWLLMEPEKPWKDRRAFGLASARQYFGLWKP